MNQKGTKPKDPLIDAKSIKMQAEKERERAKVSFSLNKTLYEEFVKACSPSPVSHIIEILMKRFIDSDNGDKK